MKHLVVCVNEDHRSCNFGTMHYALFVPCTKKKYGHLNKIDPLNESVLHIAKDQFVNNQVNT